MPELPEVESIVRALRPKLVGLSITDVWSDREKPFVQSGGVKSFRKEVRGHRIISVRRRSKFIIIDLAGPKSIFIHQKISGHLLYGAWRKIKGKWFSIEKDIRASDPKNQFIRFLFKLSNGRQLAMSDVRRFSKVLIVDDERILTLPEITKLGPEPLLMSQNEFIKLFSNKRGFIKPVLMDPFFIVGIGNIYSDEILWSAGIHPLSRVEKLSSRDIGRIFQSTYKILSKAIAMKGSSNDDYRLPSGQKGRFQEIQRAYHRHGQPCKKNDRGTIKQMRIAGRSAHFCPVHQKLIK